MATVSLFQQRSALGPDGYSVTNQITIGNGIPKELFVFFVESDLFSHVASMDDFQYPVSHAAAVTAGVPFYRLDTVTQTYPDVRSALDFADMIKDRVNKLLLVFDAEALSFVGSETADYPLSP